MRNLRSADAISSKVCSTNSEIRRHGGHSHGLGLDTSHQALEGWALAQLNFSLVRQVTTGISIRPLGNVHVLSQPLITPKSS